MIQQKKINVERILRVNRVGAWRIEIEDGKAPRFYADAVMDELLGIQGEISPEERFTFHRARVHPDDMQLFLEYSDKLSETKSEIVYRYIHPTFGEMFVRCSGIRDRSVVDGISIMGIHQDISETARMEKEKEAERRLAELNDTLRKEKIEQEDYYKELLEMQSCGVLAYTIPGHKIIHMNAQALRMYGVENIEEAQSKLGTMLKKVIYPDVDVIEKLKRLHKVDDMVDYECIIGKGEPNECHALATTKVIRVPSGERAVITTFIDVSEMVVLKNALQKAEEGNRAKSSFLFAMSHDLRTPMNAIVGFSSLLEKNLQNERKAKEYLEKIQSSSNLLLRIINQVLEMARIESGTAVLQLKAEDMDALFHRVNTVFEEDVRKKNLQYQAVLDVRHHYVVCDQTKLQEIMLNIISNAIKYTPEGHSIYVEVHEAVSENPSKIRYIFSCEDTGIGMSEEYLPHIYEEFSREHSTTENKVPGTGLGLPIIKSMIELMGGSIQVESRQGIGTKFTIDLSFDIALKEEVYGSEDTIESSVIHTIKGKRILLVEDNELNAEIAKTVLEDVGALITRAENGQQALELFKEKPAGTFDVILMDLMMPVMDGYTATRKIRELERSDAKTVPIIAMTANAFQEDAEKCIAVGMNAHLAKPLDIEKMKKTIKSICS